MTNYKDTNDAVHHLRFLAELAEFRDEEAAFQSFEEHFKTSAEDPYFEYELKLWLTAWRKALAYFTEQVAPIRRTPTVTNNADPVGSLVDQWREAAEFFTSGAGFDIRETLIDCADDLEAALATQQQGSLATAIDRMRQGDHPAIVHCDNCGCDWLDNGLNPIGCPYCKWSEHKYTIAAQEDEIKALREEMERLRADRDSWEQQASDRVADWHAEHLRAYELEEALKALISWIPSADVYRRLGFDPEAPMRALSEARAALEQEIDQ